jgi:hypothetical protein
MVASEVVTELVERYRDNCENYRAAGYKEFRLRKEFVDPFLEALGWDVANRGGYDEGYKDVVNEDTIKISTFAIGSALLLDYRLNLVTLYAPEISPRPKS